MTVAALTVTDARFTPASGRDERRGLVGYIALVLNDALHIDGVTLRRSGDGYVYLAYPCRTDGGGRRHALLRPLGDDARRLIEDQVFTELGIGESALPRVTAVAQRRAPSPHSRSERRET